MSEQGRGIATFWFILLPTAVAVIVLFSFLTYFVRITANRITLQEVNRSLIEVAKDVELTIRTMMINDPRQVRGFYQLVDGLRGDEFVLKRLKRSRDYRIEQLPIALAKIEERADFQVADKGLVGRLSGKYHQQLQEMKQITTKMDISATIIPAPVVRIEKLQDVLKRFPERYPLPDEIETVVIAQGKQYRGNLEINNTPYFQVTSPVLADPVCTSCHLMAVVGQPMAAITVRADMNRPQAAITQLTQRVIVFGAVIIGIILLIVFLVSRKIASSLAGLSQQAIQFGEGDYNSGISSSGTKEIVSLANSFEHARLKIHDFIYDILKSMPGLLFIVDQEGKASSNFSEATQEMFGDIENKNVNEVIFQPTGKDFANVIETVFDDSVSISFDDLMALAPSEIEMKEQVIKLNYHPIYREAKEELQKILIIGENITALRKSEAARAEDQKQNEMILEVVKNPEGFMEFYHESEGLIEKGSLQVGQGVDDLSQEACVETKRVLHTIKGAASIFQLHDLVETAHRFEDQLIETADSDNPVSRGLVEPMFEELARKLADTYTIYLRFFEKDAGGGLLSVTTEEAEKLVQDHPDLKKSIDSWQHKLQLQFIRRKANGIVEATARNLGKDVDLQVSGDEGRITTAATEIISLALTHLLRNAISHGIEDAYIREELGKQPEGNIKIQVQNEGENIKISIQDDGQGIDPEAIVASAISKGVLDEGAELPPQEAVELIFASGFSTAEQVSSVSGRGIGLDAVKHTITQSQGEVSVQSKVGEGTGFSIRLKRGI